MRISLVGLSYKTTPLELREKLYVHPDRVPDVLKRLGWLVPEGLLFSTCNRFEILTRPEKNGRPDRLVEFISEQCELPRQKFEPLLYCHDGPEAVRHVFRVASSLDSMVVGEAQILGQMKQFFAVAQRVKSIGVALHAVMERAFMVAKKVRTETKIASHAVSISSVAVELASKIFGNLEGKTVFVIGAGKMSLLALQNLRARGVRMILVTNRTFQKAAELAEQISGRAVPFAELANCLAESDILISSTASPNFIVRKEHILRAMAERRNKPMFLIDIAVPRNLDPQIDQIGNAFLYDVDDLKSMAEKNRLEREKEAERAERIVLQEAEIFWNRLQALDVNPTIREIQAAIEEVRRQEIEAVLTKLGSITQEQRQGIEKLACRLTDKILQSPFSELRHLAGQPDGLEKITFIRKLFGIRRNECDPVSETSNVPMD